MVVPGEHIASVVFPKTGRLSRGGTSPSRLALDHTGWEAGSGQGSLTCAVFRAEALFELFHLKLLVAYKS